MTIQDISGQEFGEFEPLKPVLLRWRKLMEEDWGKKDAPWWYNEGASVSQLAGAVWRTQGGWALEEFSVRKRGPEPGQDGSGRCDLALEVGDVRLVVEAKHLWLRWTNRTRATPRVAKAINSAMAQVVRYPHGRGRYRQAAVVFVVPWVTAKLADKPDEMEHRLRDLVDELKGLKGGAALAWSFPAVSRGLLSTRRPGRCYPGVVMVLSGRRQ